ncbi:hypothetical protein ONZ45_g11619 [Pleurotus djamor]|nr:hypothetical protein ONZ45_g11619 [Pleurotus djamor]
MSDHHPQATMNQLRDTLAAFTAIFQQLQANEQPPGMAGAPPVAASSALPPPTPVLQHQPPSTQALPTAGPVVRPYESVRLTRSTPALFPGLPNRGPTMALSTRNVNQARLASASATLPRPAGLVQRSSRRASRGPAVPPPSLPSAPSPQSLLTRCLVDGAALPTVRVTVQVYPPVQDPSHQSLFVYRFVKASFNTFLQANDLSYNLEVPLPTPISAIFETVASSMENSPSQYAFHRRPLARHAHEATHMALLGLVSRGQPRPRDDHVRLRRQPVSPTDTIETLMAVRAVYAHPVLNFDHEGGRFIIRALVSSFPLSRLINSTTFSEEDAETSGGESSTDTDDENVVAATVQGSSRGTVTAPSNPLVRGISFRSRNSFLPEQVWGAHAWTPLRGPIQGLESMTDLAHFVYNQASPLGPNAPHLELRGHNVSELVTLLSVKLDEAAASNDYSIILCSDRDFIITNPDGSTLSMGAGVEREVIYNLFQQFTSSPALHPCDGDTFSVWILYGSRAEQVPASRLQSLKRFGAVCALMMITGQTPTPIGAALFQFITHRCDLHSLHPAFIREWLPDLSQTISDWNSLGPTGNVSRFNSHFINWHGLEVLAYQDRDEETHRGLAAEMLYYASIGRESFHHPEFQAFVTGFSLSCVNGFDFTNILRGFPGGSEAFLSILWTGHISSFEDLEPHLIVSDTSHSIASSLSTHLPPGSLTSLKALLFRFLSGTGTPCPTLFEAVRHGFDQAIDIASIEETSFRSRLFAWAVTGSPHVDVDNDRIVVRFVEDNDIVYRNRNASTIASKGVISIQTFSYQPGAEPGNFYDAVDHWLLCELLNNIGSHSVL